MSSSKRANTVADSLGLFFYPRISRIFANVIGRSGVRSPARSGFPWHRPPGQVCGVPSFARGRDSANCATSLTTNTHSFLIRAIRAIRGKARFVLPVYALLVSAIALLLACAPRVTPTPAPARAAATPSVRVVPSPCPSPVPVPHLPGLTRRPDVDSQTDCVAVEYRNAAGVVVATFDPQDRTHSNGVTWKWEVMNQEERDRALTWLFDPMHLRYTRFEGREDWLIHAVTKWIPRIGDFALPPESEITLHWQTDGPPLSRTTLYEALSRIKSVHLVRERPSCSYGYSHLGLIEYGAGMVLFEGTAWQRVSQETREIITTAWTIKEAMVIYYPQWMGWASSCPCESDHLKNEYYSTIWLVKAQQALSRWVPVDRTYWEEQEIPFQIRNIALQRFPECQPAYLPDAGFGSR